MSVFEEGAQHLEKETLKSDNSLIAIIFLKTESLKSFKSSRFFEHSSAFYHQLPFYVLGVYSLTLHIIKIFMSSEAHSLSFGY